MLNLRGVGSLQETIGRSSSSKFVRRSAEGSTASAKRPRISDSSGGQEAGGTASAAASTAAGGRPPSPCYPTTTETGGAQPAAHPTCAPAEPGTGVSAAAAAVVRDAGGPRADRGPGQGGPPPRQQQQQQQQCRQPPAVVRIETLCVGMRHHRHHYCHRGSDVVAAAAPPAPLRPGLTAAGDGGHAADDSAAWAVTMLRREPCNPYDSNAILVGDIGAYVCLGYHHVNRISAAEHVSKPSLDAMEGISNLSPGTPYRYIFPLSLISPLHTHCARS